MNFVLLSGNSAHAKEWVYNLNDSVVTKFGDTYVHNYKHWGSSDDIISFNTELKSLTEKLSDFSPYVFIAKSAGCILALKSISRDIPKPKACLFLGLPIEFAKQNRISLNNLLSTIDIPIIIAQNENDPFGSYDEIKTLVNSLDKYNISIKKLEGNTHDYNNLIEISNILSKII